MLRCLFWNLQKKPFSDILNLAESSLALDMLLTCEDRNFKMRVGEMDCISGLVNDNIRIYTRNPEYFRLVHEDGRFLVWLVELPAYPTFLLVLLHFPLIRETTDSPLALEAAIDYRTRLQVIFDRTGVSRVLIVGDFNMNPFDAGMLAYSGFHGIGDAKIVAKVSRRVFGVKRRMFYNPMWNLLGDITQGPPGSTFYSKNPAASLQWHMLDQVLVSPEMISNVPPHFIRIVNQFGGLTLSTKLGRPKRRYSDHFPLYFEVHN